MTNPANPPKCEHERVMTNGCCYYCGERLELKPADDWQQTACENITKLLEPAEPDRCPHGVWVSDWCYTCEEPEQAGVIVPECPRYMAHPQAVWFEIHWRPIIDKLRAELAEAKARADHMRELVDRAHKGEDAVIKQRDAARAEVERYYHIVEEEQKHSKRLQAALDQAKWVVENHAEDFYERICELEEGRDGQAKET